MSLPRNLFLALCLSLLVLPTPLSSQTSIIGDPNWTAETLVQEVFASGTCETITNISSVGAASGLGYFTNGQAAIGLERGIILSTGPVQACAGPNNFIDAGQPLQGSSPDPFLGSMAANPLFDRVGLKFDFVPLDSVVRFRYVFASEEYCEFVGSAYNDVFGFFISGPGINGPLPQGAKNVALLPGTGQPVSINTVNHTVAPEYYRDNTLPGERILCQLPPVPPPATLPLIEFDGFTQILTATIQLIPCETYTIRLLLADVNDVNYDSAVFLEAGSFDIGGSVRLTALPQDTLPTGTPVVYEGCPGGGFRFTRNPTAALGLPQTIRYRIGQNSTAEEGTDFEPLPGQITIPAGQGYVDLPLVTLADTQDEGMEDLWLILDIPCGCYTDSVRLEIRETEPILIGLERAEYCPDEAVTLQPAVSGGRPPYSYQWSTGQTVAQPQLTPPLPPTLSLTVTDACAQQAQRQVPALVVPPPNGLLLPDTVRACIEDGAELRLQLSGTPPFTLAARRDNGPPQTYTFNSTGFQPWPLSQSGRYTLTDINDANCRGAVSGEARLDLRGPRLGPPEIALPVCADDQNGRIAVNHQAGFPPYLYIWSDGSQSDTPTLDDLGGGTYTLTVTDNLGCRDEATYRLIAPPPLRGIQIDCRELRRPPLVLQAAGGRGPYTYSTDGGNSFFPPEDFSLLQSGSVYNLLVRDASGCTLLQPDWLYPTIVDRFARLPTFIDKTLGRNYLLEPIYLLPAGQRAAVEWKPAAAVDCAGCPRPNLVTNEAQSIKLIVTDIYGCQDSTTTWVGINGRVPVYAPTAFSPDGNGTNDLFFLQADRSQVTRILRFGVYDRWGAQVYALDEFYPGRTPAGWDGKVGSRPAPPAVYAWTAEVELINGDRFPLRGTVVLVR